jgi:hypothetical protein
MIGGAEGSRARHSTAADSQLSSKKSYPTLEARRFTLGRSLEFSDALFRAELPLSNPVADQPEAAIALITALHAVVLTIGAVKHPH